MPTRVKILVSFGLLIPAILIIGGYIMANADYLSLLLNIPTWVFLTPLIILFIIPLFFASKIFFVSKEKLNYDSIRKQHLEFLRKGFHKYYEVNGHYPQSNLGEHYNKKWIRIPRDWLMFQFPSETEMRKYAPEIPLHDPTSNINDPNGIRQYLYKVSEDGNSFAIYTKMDNINDPDASDYNTSDNIDPNLGVFNYKIVS